MDLHRVEADDGRRVRAAATLLEVARRHDDPGALAITASELEHDLRWGYDLNPALLYLLEPGVVDDPVGMLRVEAPVRDNRHVLYAEIIVHPAHRHRGYGSTLLEGLVDLAAEQGRTTLWTHVGDDDPVGQAFLTGRGFTRASGDARRHQVLADVDPGLVDRLEAQAGERAADYELVRLLPPYGDALLTSLVEVTAAINDAPMGTLDHEEEVFDLARLRDSETAWRLRGDRLYRVAARHRRTGEIGGHSYLVVDPAQPQVGYQGDTAVARDHRGHRLGLALKIEMLRWLAQTEPQLEVVETWNNLDNHFMIDVNEAMGYRLSRTFGTYQRVLS